MKALHLGFSSVGMLAGLVLSGMLAACATSTEVKVLENALSQEEARAELAIESAKRARDADPSDIQATRGLVQAYLDAKMYTDAYQEAIRLRELDPESTTGLELLGKACIGLGLFDQAAACYHQALLKDPEDKDATGWLATLLAARGDRDDARVLLNAAIERWSDWTFYEQMAALTMSRDEELALLDHYLGRVEDEEIEAYRDALSKGAGPDGIIVQGRGEPLKVKISDTGKVSVLINGVRTMLQFDSDFSGLALGDDFARREQLQATQKLLLRGLGGTGVAEAKATILERLQLGSTVWEKLPAVIMPDLGLARTDGVVGPDILRGYSFRLDRKNEVLEMFPPDSPIPPPTGPHISQRYYRIGHHILTDVTVRNRIMNKSWKVKMLVDTGANQTILNHRAALRYGFGNVDATQTSVFRGLAGYGKLTEVRFSEVQFGGAAFAFEVFPAGDFQRFGEFIPFGLLGRDILGRFIVTVNENDHSLTLEPYE